MSLPVKKNDQLRLEIIDLSHEGMGIAKVDGYLLFVENALVGEIIQAQVLKVGKKFGYAKVLSWEKQSENRSEFSDNQLIRTGIAPLMHLKYSEQLKFKRQQVQNALARVAKMPDVPVLETLGMENPLAYRNKAQVPVRKVNGQLETGFYRKNTHDLVPIEDFYIQDPVIDQTIIKVRDILREVKAKPYNETDNTGDIKHIVVRRGHYSHELMIILVTRKEKLFNEKWIVQRITEEIPQVNSLIQNVNAKPTNVILGEINKVLYGSPTISDSLLGNQFAISPQSFYQVNTQMTEKLYQTAIDFADLQADDIAIDAYCGIGTIGQSFAKKVQKVYGMEIVPQAILDAKENAKNNGISNTIYEAGPAEEVMEKWVEDGIEPSVIFVDPPRKGLTKSFIASCAQTKASRIVYISCNPATFARDAVDFAELGYELVKVQPVDLFPQTYHVETVALLTRKK